MLLQREKTPRRRKGGGYNKLDQAVYKYFLNVGSQNIPVSGPMLKEKAMSYARQLRTDSQPQGI